MTTRVNNNADALLFTHKVCVEAPQTLRSHRRNRLREFLLACLRAKRFDMGVIMDTNNTSDKTETTGKSPWTAKRVAAIIGIILLAGLYLLTFISALIGTESSGRLFRFSLGMTIAVPIFLWLFIWCISKFRNR